MFANMRIGARLTLGFGVVLTIALLIGASGLYNARQFSEDVARLDSSNTRGAADLAEARNAMWQLNYDIAQFMLEPKDRQRVIDDGPVQQKILEENLRRFETAQRSPEELRALQEVRAAFALYMQARPKWFQLYAEDKRWDAAQWRAQTLAVHAERTAAALGKLVGLQRESAAAIGREVMWHVTLFRWALFTGLVGALSMGVLLAYWITRSITRPLHAAVVVAQEVATGNLAIGIDARTRDEAGRLLAALAEMRDGLAAAVDSIRQSAVSVGTASRQIALGSTEMSSRTEQQAASLEETASSMEELTTTVRQNADNARQANELAIGASGVAGEGGQVMHKVITTMDGISEASRRIADIIGVIDGIAFQTNILALNAAVEAARAGESGRGFAVVAAEVRSLAQRSAAAAKEIKGLIDDSVARVDDGTRLVQGAGKTMEQVVEAVQRVTGIMADIATASREQLTGIEQVANAVTQMDRMTQQNAALVTQTASAAENMSVQAQHLLSSVERFKLHEVAAPTAPVERTPAPAAVRMLEAEPLALGIAASD